ncbi:MAG: L-rhamnose/proton symporter RhaT [Candidatus Sulfotelmatobacter sp.]|jgi:L-rhamnose-H+ transport protein
MDNATTGLILLMVAGMVNGSFTVPMKFTKGWAWENIWLLWSIFALVVFPPVCAFSAIPHLFAVYSGSSIVLILTIAGFGLGWGVSQLCFGLATNSIGIALTFSIAMGISAAVGSLVPMVLLHSQRIWSLPGLAAMVGVAILLVGVFMCARASRLREQAAALSLEGSSQTREVNGVFFAVCSGLGGAMVNFGVAFGGPLIARAEMFGANSAWSPNVVWLPLMLGGAIPNLIYCVYLLRTNRSSAKFRAPESAINMFYALVMAVFWFGSTSLYGVAAGKLGAWGTVLGWPLFSSVIVITASVLGIVTGEWKNTGKRPLRFQVVGVALLVLAVFVLSSAGQRP